MVPLTLWSAVPHRATITDHDRAVLSLKAQRKKMEDQSKMVSVREQQQQQGTHFPAPLPKLPLLLLVSAAACSWRTA
jgi:antitoxin (DNA-binding transcriptional repressor) of toxin-antitoxin stability system